MRNLLLASAALLFTTVVSHADTTTVKLCTGEKGQAYQQAGMAIKSFAKGNRVVKIELVENTGGSSNNVARATEGAPTDAGNCDAFLAQPNALSDLATKNRGTLSIIQQVGTLHDEYAQMVCSKDSGVKSLKTLASDPKKYSVALGQAGSGAWLTWQTFVSADPRLKDVSVTPEETAIALT
ncbi:MAG: C4-dicarboxylate ABC transporter substrate-binding protein, partial [Cytophagaceae bacterium]